MAKINVIEKTPGKHLEYRVSGEKIIFGDDDLSVKLSTRERDEETVLDITADKDQGLMMGTGGNAHNYAAQIVITARRYEEQEKEMRVQLMAAMEKYGVKSFENEDVKFTYVAATTRTTIDSTKLKKELPDVAAKYSKTSNVSASVKITVK